MTDPKAHDPRAVEALAWELEADCLDHCCYGKKLVNPEKAARFILSREAALVAALERIAQAHADSAYDHDAQRLSVFHACAAWARDTLAAHRASRQPSEPTLAEAVERMFSNATSVLPFVSVPMEFKRDDVVVVRAALARARENGGAR